MVISLGSVEIPSPKIFLNLPWTFEKIHCITIGSAVREILRYTQTYRKTDRIIIILVAIGFEVNILNVCHYEDFKFRQFVFVLQCFSNH